MTTCASGTCGSAADVMVDQVDGPDACVCWRHLMRMLLAGRQEIRGFRRLGWEPRCFHPGCDEPSVAVVRDQDDVPLPACRHHFDALSWIELPGRLMSDEPGQSRG
jgi:hypothetical protein